MFVIGTAGHVDHGKSALVQALTGIDPDRLREEKERGLTIDLGFAWFTLPGGEEVSVVDVPGHERFIKNMLAGVGGVDLALLVIAADEGVMPQTREHLAIVDLLGIEHGVVAITKADLVEQDFLELAIADAQEELAGTAVEGAPIVGCSAKTGAALDELKTALESALEATPHKRDIGRPRLPIDRAFTITGFGTVVTGTLLDGTLAIGDEVEIVPGGLRSRVRGLQAHGEAAEIAHPGRRTAINLGGVSVDQLSRGMLVTSPGAIKPATSFDLRLRAVRYVGRPIRHNLEVTFHTGSAEVEGRLLLLDADRVEPGDEAWAQIRLKAPVAAVKGDRFIIRDPNDTLGGGMIVDAHVKRHKRHDPPTVQALAAMAEGSPEEMILLSVSRLQPVEVAKVVADSELDAATARSSIESLVGRGELVSLDESLSNSTLLYSTDTFVQLSSKVGTILADYHDQSPLREGMPREEVRVRLDMAPKAFDKAVNLWSRRGEIRVTGATLALADHRPKLTEDQITRARAYVESLRVNRFAPSPDIALEDDLLGYLDARGEIVRVGDGIAFAAEGYAEMVEQIKTRIAEVGPITLAQVRDMFGTSRKYAQALLEHMDDHRITRRVGDERVLR